ncbi:hypothetical protein TWF718_008062 [Orbilia javanica]|uniref:Uncharacterized protein n=1 Tax=Orbilia javanica TaxID=47235 RepID=A0AAN8NTK8_9PEZI
MDGWENVWWMNEDGVLRGCWVACAELDLQPADLGTTTTSGHQPHCIASPSTKLLDSNFIHKNFGGDGKEGGRSGSPTVTDGRRKSCAGRIPKDPDYPQFDKYVAGENNCDNPGERPGPNIAGRPAQGRPRYLFRASVLNKKGKLEEKEGEGGGSRLPAGAVRVFCLA